VFVEGGVYHVYNRLARGAELFREGDEAARFVELFREARDRDGLTIFAWCVMSNHYHLALRTGPVGLSRTIGSVQARFGQGHNIRHRSFGPLWQSRFKAKLVDDGRYLDQLVLYIHLNPVTAGVVDDPAGCPLSGHGELLRTTRSPLVDAEQTLSLFGETLRGARRRYVKALEGAREVEWRAGLPGRLPWWPREPDRPLEPRRPSVWIDERGVSTGLERRPMSAADFLDRACAALDVSLARLAGSTRDTETSRLRVLVAGVGIERWGVRAKDLADVLGRWPDSVSRWARQAGALRSEDEGFRASYETLDEKLVTSGTAG